MTTDRPKSTWRANRPGVAFAVVALGGAGGAVARVALERAFPVEKGGFPTTTLCINLAGALLIGALTVVTVQRRVAHPLIHPLCAIGILGGFTTFATFAVEVDLLLRAGRVATGCAYVAVTLVGGLVAVVAGTAATRWGFTRLERRPGGR